eukprot:CAMPEP_0182887484 /NCGR_PEP_ID=MMETSP0034_2-20130328/20854_1 /TAXON_ID=156128 /ORGANISM="Nephroselmis pyriformis, Strain CCMP717" /LENGTH=127 /DNA_ID=CAMNT_0025020849 /DNA_START=89 /DNA_END=468 /DNA_ORIENTATION=-
MATWGMSLRQRPGGSEETTIRDLDEEGVKDRRSRFKTFIYEYRVLTAIGILMWTGCIIFAGLESDGPGVGGSVDQRSDMLSEALRKGADLRPETLAMSAKMGRGGPGKGDPDDVIATAEVHAVLSAL